LPPLCPGRPVQRVEPPADVAEVDGILGDQGRGQDAVGRSLEAGGSVFLVLRLRCGRGLAYPTVRPADLAVWRELVEGRVGGRAEIDVAVHDDWRGMDDADFQIGAFGGESPFLFELAGVELVDRRLAPGMARAEDVAVVGWPVFDVVLSRCQRGKGNCRHYGGQQR